jgi:hypothetical protein
MHLHSLLGLNEFLYYVRSVLFLEVVSAWFEQIKV